MDVLTLVFVAAIVIAAIVISARRAQRSRSSETSNPWAGGGDGGDGPQGVPANAGGRGDACAFRHPRRLRGSPRATPPRQCEVITLERWNRWVGAHPAIIAVMMALAMAFGPIVGLVGDPSPARAVLTTFALVAGAGFGLLFSLIARKNQR